MLPCLKVRTSKLLPAILILMSIASAAPRISVHGHRGARAARPENSLPAFQYALDIGVDVLELDLAVTADDIVVVSHDATMNPKYCQGPANAETVIRKMTFAQLRAWDCGAKPNPDFPQQQPVPGTRVPTLQEVFDLVRKRNAKVEFNIETKINPARPELAPTPEKFVELLLAVLRKNNMVDRTIVQSFDYRTLHAMKRLEPRLRLSALSPVNAKAPHRPLTETAREAGAQIVSPQYRTVKPEEVAAAHQAGLQVVPWTANDPASWDVLIAAQVDAIITDDPAALIAHLKAKGLR